MGSSGDLTWYKCAREKLYQRSLRSGNFVVKMQCGMCPDYVCDIACRFAVSLGSGMVGGVHGVWCYVGTPCGQITFLMLLVVQLKEAINLNWLVYIVT